MPPKTDSRTVALAAVALLLVAATVYDYTRKPGDSTLPGEAGNLEQPEPAAGARPSRIAALSKEAEELKHFLAYAPQIRARYSAIAAPYAESVATFAALYPTGASPAESAKKGVAALLPKNVEMSDFMVARSRPDDKGATWLNATLVLNSSDSEAFGKAVLALGDAANGSVWKELTIAADAEHRTLRASGQLALLAVEQAE